MKYLYYFISILVLIITFLVYFNVDKIVSSQEILPDSNSVYLRSIDKIPVLKTHLPTTALEEYFQEINYDIDLNSFSAKSIYIEDINSGTVLLEKNSTEVFLPASTTKIMTALVAVEVYEDFDASLTIDYVNGVRDSKIGFFLGEQILIRDLIKASLIQSSNEAAYTLALNLNPNRDISDFVLLMNKKAKELNLNSTYFENPAGFDGDNQKTSARDLAILSKELLKNEFLSEVVGIKHAVITDASGAYRHNLFNTNQLLWSNSEVVGLKTGTTDGASQVLITQVNNGENSILIVVMGSTDRYLETNRLIDWVFNSHVWVSPNELL
jgi:serine-type D-Ala-D-Ala carboxypeptidase (penicillin-binding protein 5/6)